MVACQLSSAMIRFKSLVVSGIGILYSFARVVPEAEIFVKELQDWILSFFSLTLATNIICTGKPRHIHSTLRNPR